MKTLTNTGLDIVSTSDSGDRTGGLNRVISYRGEPALIAAQLAISKADSWYQSHTVERTGTGLSTLTVNFAEPTVTIEWSRSVEDFSHSLYLHPRWARATVWTGNPSKETIRIEIVQNSVEQRDPTGLTDGSGNTADELPLYQRMVSLQTNYTISTYTLHYQLQYKRDVFSNPVQFSDEVLIYQYADLQAAFGALSVQNKAPELVQTNAVPHVGEYLSIPPEMRVRTDGSTEMSGFFIFAKDWDDGVYNAFT